MSPRHATVNGKSTSDSHSYIRDVEEGPFGRINPNNGIHGNCEETNPLLDQSGPIHPKPYAKQPCNCNDQTISFREIFADDRKRIQELFEEWFPVDYKEEFYDGLCNTRTMADQKLYTLLATVSYGDGNDDKIIACLLGCKLGARKLNEASRALLIPGYESKHKDNNTSGLDKGMDELEACGEPSMKNDNGENIAENILQKEVFYIMTLGVIEEYRKRGLASYLVERAIQEQIVVASKPIDIDDQATDLDKSMDDDVYEEFEGAEIYQRNDQSNESTCETAYLHVIIQNQAAIRFYEKLGFQRLREIADYYTIEEKKHNCYLYAKFYDRASIIDRREREKGLYSYYCYHYSKSLGLSSPILNFFNKTIVHWITSIWSSVSYYMDMREGGRNPALAAAKNK